MESTIKTLQPQEKPPIRPTSESYTTLWSDAHWIDMETIEKMNAAAEAVQVQEQEQETRAKNKQTKE